MKLQSLLGIFVGHKIEFTRSHDPETLVTATLENVGDDWIEIKEKGYPQPNILPFTSIGHIRRPKLTAKE